MSKKDKVLQSVREAHTAGLDPVSLDASERRALRQLRALCLVEISPAGRYYITPKGIDACRGE